MKEKLIAYIENMPTNIYMVFKEGQTEEGIAIIKELIREGRTELTLSEDFKSFKKCSW